MVFILFSCQHYGSNVEIVYKNANGSSYNETGSDVLKSKPNTSVSTIKEEVYEEDSENPKNSNSKSYNASKNEASITTEAPAKNEAPVKNERPIISDSPVKSENSAVKASEFEQYHVVQKGETYYSIARLYFLSPATLMKINGAHDKQVLKTGTIIKLYEDDERMPKPVTANSSVQKVEQTSDAKLASSTSFSATPLQEKSVTKQPEIKGGTSGCGEKFIMPIASKNILHNFGDKLDGGIKSDGTIFKITSEEPVFAANKGEVAYVGDGFSDYGNIVIIKHANSYFSIYGYLKSINLQKGQNVAKGEKISTTSVKDGKFYFSVRKGKTAVNLQSCL